MDLAEALEALDGDRQILGQLAKRGDDHARVHSVDHHFLAAHEGPLRELGKFGQGLGFVLADLGPEEGGHYSCNLVSHTSLSLSGVQREGLLMEFLAQLHHVEYDGWGTQVEK